jgi:hypothetical protein
MKTRFILSAFFIVFSHWANAQGTGMVFSDEFANNDRNWHVEYVGSRSTFLENQAYNQEGYNNKVVCYTTQLVQLDPALDFKIVIDTWHLGGRLDKPYGFSFGPDRKDATYYCTIAADGRFMIILGSKKIADWCISPAISPRNNKNKLTLAKEGSTCFLYINDQKVTSFPIENFKPHELFFIGLYAKGQQKIQYDNVVVYGSK